jgi:parallel beta-helix repeat protein
MESFSIFLQITISTNEVTNNGYGIYLDISHNNTISGNNLTNNEHGVFLLVSHFNVLRNNRMVDNGQKLIIHGGDPADLTQYMDTSNTVNGKPVYYWVEERDKTVPSDTGYVALTRCTNITVQNLHLTNNGQGILLASKTYSTITKNTITNNSEYGILISDSVDNSIYGNNIAHNEYGIHIDSWMEATNNTIHHNNFINNTEQASAPGWWHMIVFEEH